MNITVLSIQRSIKSLWLSVLVFSLVPFSVFSQAENTYSISLKIKGMTDEVAYLGYHMDGKTYVKDTVQVNDEMALFSGDEVLPAGVYFLYTPGGVFHEFLVKDQEFSIVADKANILETIEIENSKENELFVSFQRRMANYQRQSKALQERLAQNPQDSIALYNELQKLGKENETYGDSTLAANSNTFYAQLMAQMARPKNIEVPDGLTQEEAQLFQYLQYRSRFWENINFAEPGILRTPIFHTRLKEYFEKVVPTHPDSLAVALDDFLSIEPMHEEVFQYILVTMINLYANSKIMGMDAVYVHLVDNYYAKGKAPWTDETNLNRMVQTSDRLRTLLIGKKAPDFYIPDVDGNRFGLTSFEQDYLIIFIYDSGCGHCKKSAPKMAASYNALKETMSVELVSINISDDKEEWTSFITEYGLTGTNLGDLEGTSNIGYYYYVTSTPQIYVLDKDRKIIAKKLGAEQIEDFLKNYSKSQS